MIREVERDLGEMGITYKSETVQDKVLVGEAQDTIELFGYSYCLTDSLSMERMMDYMKCDYKWALAEISDRLYGCPSGDNPGIAYMMSSAEIRSFWSKFLRDGLFSYTYAERFRWQMPYVLNELRLRPNSRQAMMTMYDANKDIMNWGGKDRVPCSVSYQFLIRDGKLNIVYNQRSCDFLKFFAYDVYFTISLQQYIANQLKLVPGNFVHFIGSLHAFRNEVKERKIF
jgi:thymidylate synthase